MLAYENHRPDIGADVFVAPGAVVVGRVTIGPDSSVFYNAVVRGDINTVAIGARTNIQDACIIHVNNDADIVIGSDVTVGHAAILHGCRIGDRAKIGMGAIILDKAEIGAGSIVAAGSLVPPRKSFPPGSFLMGHPARLVRELEPDEIADNLRVAAHYVDMKNRYLAEYRNKR